MHKYRLTKGRNSSYNNNKELLLYMKGLIDYGK